MTLEAHVIQGVHHEIATLAIGFPHFEHGFLAIAQRLKRGFLTDNAGTQHGVLMDPRHGADQRLGAASEADAETGHGVGFGKAVQKNRALPHARQAGDANVFALKGELGIYLVSNHDEIMFHCQIRNGLQFFAGHRAAGGIGGEI